MERTIVGLLCATVVAGLVTLPATSAIAQQKTAKQCTEEWRANKADNQAKGITEKAYVTQCRAGGTAAQPTAAPAPAPAPARAPAPTATAPKAVPPRTTTTAAAPAGANQFAAEAQAKSRCPTDTVVWANLSSKIYHFSGHRDYGHTKDGTYMCERDATAAGIRAAKNEKHP